MKEQKYFENDSTMNCRGLFASALITTQQQQRIKLPHICIPKAYTYLHLFSSHPGYVVRKCYDFKTLHAVSRCSETIQFGKIAFDLYAKSQTVTNLMRFAKWNRHAWTCMCSQQNHANGGVLLHSLLSANLRMSLSVSRNTSASKFIAL